MIRRTTAASKEAPVDKHCKRLLIQLHSWRDEPPHVLDTLLSRHTNPRLTALLDSCKSGALK